MRIDLILSLVIIGLFNVGLIFAVDYPVLIFFKENVFEKNQITVGQSLTESQFISQYLNLVQKSSVDVLVVNELRDEDLRNILSQHEFSIKNFNYQPSVESPYTTLKTFFSNNPEVKYEEFKDAQKAFNTFLTKTTGGVQNDVVILTAKGDVDSNLVHKRRRRDVSSNSESNLIYTYGNQCAAYFSSIYIVDSSGGPSMSKTSTLDYANSTFTCSETASTLTIVFNPNATVYNSPITQIDIVLNSSNSSYYKLDLLSSSLTTKDKKYGTMYLGVTYGMETPVNFTFVCTKTYFVLFNSSIDSFPTLPVQLFIENFQIQPFGMLVNGSNYTFGRVNYCQGFFSPGIWMGITSSLLLTSILALGIVMLFNIKTMDKFDDPKGKPLSIPIEK